MPKSKEIGFLYINGLGNGKITTKDKIMKWWWSRAGHTIEHAHVDWYNGGLADKMNKIEQKTNDMLRTFDGVVIIGSSAGGSLAVNSLYRMRNKNVCAVNAHGRLIAGDYADSDFMSLRRRARLDTPRPSQAFFDSVTTAENKTIPSLATQQKERILVLTQLTDLVVPLNTMTIAGVRRHRSIAFGHSGGWMAHFLADRDLIARFAAEKLVDRA